MLARLLSVILVAAPFYCLGVAVGEDFIVPVPPAKTLFNSDVVLALSLLADFDALCRPNEVEDCDYTPTRLVYRAEDGTERSLAVEIRVRGGWRARKDHCDVPPLFVRFSMADTAGTPFTGQEMLPLTTHCRSSRAKTGIADGKAYEQYVLKEYYIYRLYNTLSDRSLRVRLAEIDYSSPSAPGKNIERYAFFTEHFDDLAARNDARWSSKKTFEADRVDPITWDRVALFNYMIGNTDSSVVRERNILLITGEDGRQYPVPYDFDMSGLVDPEYGGVSPRLDFRDAKHRYYLGYCHPQIDFPSRIAEFEKRKDVLLGQIEYIRGIMWSAEKTTRSYLKRFFNILASPRKTEARIVSACQPWPPSLEDHTTPPDPA
jgi:hypothetical protein